MHDPTSLPHAAGAGGIAREPYIGGLSKRPRDPNQLGKLIVDIGVGEVEDSVPTREDEGTLPAAVEIGRKGGAAGAAKMDPARRTEIARKAAAKRLG